MEVYPDGRIAYHSLLFVKGGVDFVQYDLDGKEKYRLPYTRHTALLTDISN